MKKLKEKIKIETVENNLPFLTEYDRVKMEYYSKYPELILETSEWRAVALCATCLGEIDLIKFCLHTGINKKRDVEHRLEYFKCPHCNKWGTITEKLNSPAPSYLLIGIPHYVVRIRTHVLEYKIERGWFKKSIKTPSSIFKEIVLVEDHSKPSYK